MLVNEEGLCVKQKHVNYIELDVMPKEDLLTIVILTKTSGMLNHHPHTPI